MAHQLRCAAIWLYIYIFIYLLLCSISECFWGVFKCSSCSVFWPPDAPNHFETQESCFPPVMRQTLSGNDDLLFVIQCVQNGVLMLRNIGSPLSNAYRHRIFERIYFRYSGPFLANPQNLEALIFVVLLWQSSPFSGTPPPNTFRRIFPIQKKRDEMKNVNNGGSLHLEQKIENPYFCSISCDKLKRLSVLTS